MALTTTRGQGAAAFFKTWELYCRSWDTSGQVDSTFCRAIADVYHPLIAPELRRIDRLDLDVALAQKRGASEDDLSAARSEIEETRQAAGSRLGFPWITPVLGSGCLSAQEGPEGAAISTVPAELAIAIGDFDLPDGSPTCEVVERFSRSLIEAKVGHPGVVGEYSYPHTKAAAKDRTIAAWATLCAYLFSRLYFAVGNVVDCPVGLAVGVLRFCPKLDGPTPQGAEIWDNIVVPVKQAVRTLQNEIDGSARNDLSFVAAFADAVTKDLNEEASQVSVADVALMSEIAWHLMSEGTSQYPGSGDLLTLLTMANETTDRDQRWPQVKSLEAARRKLNTELLRTTRLSWKSRLPGQDGVAAPHEMQPSIRDRLYDAVAEILIAQANRHKTQSKGDVNELPPAVTFITSFDIELEMALVAKRRPFRLVMPFYVRPASSSQPTGFVWLQTRIKPPEGNELLASDLDRLITTEEWSLLTTHQSASEDDFSLPVVVRLAGSPLIRVSGFPDLGGHAGPTVAPWVKKLKASIGGDHMTIHGTVLLDEHTALHQWAADLVPPPNSKTPEARLGLPKRLIKGGGPNDARFWFVLGVQLSDEAVRHRTAAIVGAADLRSDVTDTPLRAVRSGVVINRRSTANERDVFLWQGMDVVQATYDEVIPALTHAAAHAANPIGRRIKGYPCPLGGAR